MTLTADEITDFMLGIPHYTGWFRKGERYQVKDQVYVILFDTPKNDIVVSVRILSADGTVLDKGAKGRGVMAKGIRDATPIKD